jgi:hypothetical protein
MLGKLTALKSVCIDMRPSTTAGNSTTRFDNAASQDSDEDFDDEAGLPTCMWTQAALIASSMSKSLKHLPKLEHLQLTLRHTGLSPQASDALKSVPADVQNECGLWPPIDWALPASTSTLTSLHLAGLALGSAHMEGAKV